MNKNIINKNYNDILFTSSLLNLFLELKYKKKYLKYKFKYNKLKYFNLN